MEQVSNESATIVRFRNGQTTGSNKRDQKCFLDAVFAAGSLPVAADDEATKRIAARLTVFGFVTIDEIDAAGSLRRLKPSEAFHASGSLPWLVSKPSSWSVGDVTLAVGGRANLPQPFVG